MKKQIIILSLVLLGTSIFSAEDNRNKKELLAIRDELEEKIIQAIQDRDAIEYALRNTIQELGEHLESGDKNSLKRTDIDDVVKSRGLPYNMATILVAYRFASFDPKVKDLMDRVAYFQAQMSAYTHITIPGLSRKIIELNNMLQR